MLRPVVAATSTLAIAFAAPHATSDAHAPQATAGTLAATVTHDTSRAVPTEGSVSYVSVRNARGRGVLQAELRETANVASALVPGRYRLSTYQRTCSGTCALLDAPSHRCFRDVRVRAGRRLAARITVRWGQRRGCSISIR
jgi:hypothetical protein